MSCVCSFTSWWATRGILRATWMSRCDPNNGCLFRCVCLKRGVEEGRGRGDWSAERRRPPQLMRLNGDDNWTGFPLAPSVPPTRDNQTLCLCLSFFPPSLLLPPPLLKGFICARRPSGCPRDRSSISRSAALRIRGAFVCVIWVEIQPLNSLRNKRKKYL